MEKCLKSLAVFHLCTREIRFRSPLFQPFPSPFPSPFSALASLCLRVGYLASVVEAMVKKEAWVLIAFLVCQNVYHYLCLRHDDQLLRMSLGFLIPAVAAAAV